MLTLSDQTVLELLFFLCLSSVASFVPDVLPHPSPVCTPTCTNLLIVHDDDFNLR